MPLAAVSEAVSLTRHDFSATSEGESLQSKRQGEPVWRNGVFWQIEVEPNEVALLRLSVGEGDAGDLLQVVDEAYVAPLGQESGEGFALAVADLKGEEAVGFERGVCLGDQTAIDAEAFGAGEECGWRLVVADLGVEGGAVGLGDVGRVADDGVEGCVLLAGRERVEEIGFEEADAVGYVVGLGIGLGDLQGFGGEVEGGDVGLREVDGQGDCDGSGAGAYVGDAYGLVVREALEDGFDEVLGLGARDEDGGSDLKSETVELLLAGDVLDGFVLEAAGDEGFVESFVRSEVSSRSG